MPRYKSGKLIMTAAHYESGKLMMTSLIIIKIRFICFSKDEIGVSRVRSHARSHNYKSRDHGVTIKLAYNGFCQANIGGIRLRLQDLQKFHSKA